MYAQIDQEGNILATTHAEVTSTMPDGVIQVPVPDEAGEVCGYCKYNHATKAFEQLPPTPPKETLESKIVALLKAKGLITQEELDSVT